MFEETGVEAFHVDRVFGRMKLVVIEAVANGTDWILDATQTSPGIAITAGGGTTPVFTGVSTGSNFWYGGPQFINSVITGRIGATDNPTTGTFSVITSAVTNGVRMTMFLIVNRTG